MFYLCELIYSFLLMIIPQERTILEALQKCQN